MYRIKDVPVPTTSLSPYFFRCHLLIYLCNTNCLEPGQAQWIPKFLKENVCSGYSLEAALSNENDSFTLSRLMKRSKTCCDPIRDEYPQLTFFSWNIQKAFQQCLSLFDVELRHYLNAVHIYLIGSHAKVAEVVNSVDYESASNMSRYI